MIPVGDRPILWHIMKWYASWGHDDFILCLGYKGECIKEYFLNYNEALVERLRALERRPRRRAARQRHLELADHVRRHRRQVDDRRAAAAPSRRISATTSTSSRRTATASPTRRFRDMIDRLRTSGKTGLFLSVRPVFNAHVVARGRGRRRPSVEDMQQADVWINGGFFVFRRDILDYINPGEELVVEPFPPADRGGELLAYRYEGFWEPMDTIKDKQRLDALAESGHAPWRLVGAQIADGRLMLRLQLAGRGSRSPCSLHLAAHADDIEIGCGATILALTRARTDVEVTWVVLSAEDERVDEARASARRVPRGGATRGGAVHGFRDGFFPYVGGEVKDVFEALKASVDPDLDLTHTRFDLHQDHRLVAS